MSRHSVATKGIYTLVYEDREGSPLIAYFTPSGGGGCYHHNGGLRMLYDKEGGSLFDEVRSNYSVSVNCVLIMYTIRMAMCHGNGAGLRMDSTCQ